jgi:surface carbohydrate biosynthesis protein
MQSRASLIIPIENQVRELDPKLLLACIAARRGFDSIIGSRLEIDFRIASFPRSIYLSKSMTARSVKMFRIMSQLGHKIAVWDEEALVHMQPEAYFTRRLSPRAIGYVSLLFAWGRENAELWRQYPALPENMPIHITGNPRGDLLRPRLLGYFDKETAEIRKSYGDFILINTNFSNVNAFVPSLNLFHPGIKAGEKPKFGRAAVGMSREYAEGLRDYKQAVFEDIKGLIPRLENAFENHTLIVRPHPTEDPSVYQEIASQCKRVKVTNQGNVIPWLRAAGALVHNSCTTGVEAYMMGVPAVTYMATRNEFYDDGYYRLPNRISHRCFNFEELRATLAKILAGEIGAANGDEHRALIDYYLAAQQDRLACDRIVDVIEQTMAGSPQLPKPAWHPRFIGRYRAGWRRLIKWCKSHLPDSKYRPEFQRHRYPGLSLKEIESRILRFRQVLGDNTALQAKQITDHIFKISIDEKK